MSEDNQKKSVYITSVAPASEEKKQDNLVVEEESCQESTPQLKRRKINAIREAIDKLICIAHRILLPKGSYLQDANDMHDVVDLCGSPTEVNGSINCLEEEEEPKVKRGHNHDNACFDQSGETLDNFRNQNEPKKAPIQPRPIPRVPVLLSRQPYPQWWSTTCPYNEPFFNRGSSSTNGNDYKGKEVVTDEENDFSHSWRVLTWGPPSYLENPLSKNVSSNISFHEWVEDMHEKGFFSRSELRVMLSYKEMMDTAMGSKITTADGVTHNHHQFLSPPPPPPPLPASDTTPPSPGASGGLHEEHTRSSGRTKRKPSRFKDFCM